MPASAFHRGSPIHRASTDWLSSVEQSIDRTLKRSRNGLLLWCEIYNYPILMQLLSVDEVCRLSELLIQELELLIGPEDSLHRNSPYRFCICIADLGDATALRWSEAIQQTVQRLFSMLNSQPDCTPSYLSVYVGAAHFPSDATSAHTLMEKAYIALKYAEYKRLKHFADHQEVLTELPRQEEAMRLASELLKALYDKKLRLAYQPVVDAATRDICYHECLLRIETVDQKLRSAGPGIAVVEEMGLIDAIDILVLNKAFAELIAYPDITLAINVSGASVLHAHWLDACLSLIKQHPEVTKRLIVEITETVIMQDVTVTSQFISALQQAGCRVALDDFGTGHTSLRQLKNLKPDIVKIDGEYVRDILTNPNSRMVVECIIGLCQHFNITTVAEFVETEEAAVLLTQLGIDHLQGYFFASASPERHSTKQ